MSCQNCAITIRRIVGSPASYKIRFAHYPPNWSEERANNSHDPTFVRLDRGAVIAQNVTNAQLETDPLVIFVGSPNGSEYADFWRDGNSITLRFENQDNENCFLEQTWSCETTTTTTAIADCCTGFINTIETHGYNFNSDGHTNNFEFDTITPNTSSLPNNGDQFEQQRINSLRTVGFANGTFRGARGFVPATDGVSPDTTVGNGTGIQIYPGTTESGTGRLCFNKINPNSNNQINKVVLVRENDNLLDDTAATITTGSINIQGEFASGQSSVAVYIHSDGTCWSGDLATTNPIVIFTPYTG